jgi:hypothetical protein
MARIKIEDLPRPAETLNPEEARAVGGGRLSFDRVMEVTADIFHGAGCGVEYVGDQVRAGVGGNRISDTERTLTNFLGGVEGFYRTFSSFDAYGRAFKDFYGG